MQIKDLLTGALAGGVLFAAYGSLLGCSSAKPAAKLTVADIWPHAVRAAALPAKVPAGWTPVAEYERWGQTAYCVPYREDARNRVCSDDPENFSAIKNPLIVMVGNPNSPHNPFMQP